MVLSHRLHVWNSRRAPHLGRGHGRPHQQAGHMTAIASIRRCSSLAGRGPSTYGSRLGSLALRRSPSGRTAEIFATSATRLPTLSILPASAYNIRSGREAFAWRRRWSVMPVRDIFVVGASAGGVAALQRLVGGLPEDFPGSLFVVLHMSPESPGSVPDILARAGRLPATNARNGEKIIPGRIYVAPPDRHLVVEAPGDIRLGHGPKENRFRPAVDPLFRSAALAYGPRATGIVLTGGLDDGTAGLCAVKQAGGTAIVQDPKEAEVPSMPASAMRHVAVDHCLGIDAIAALLPRLAAEPVETRERIAEVRSMSKDVAIEVQVAADERRRESAIRRLGDPSLFTCPECHGSLLQMRNATPSRFRCHTGHAFTAVSLEAELNERIEAAAWNTIRSLEEHAMLLNHMADNSDNASAREGARLRAKAERALKRAALIREAVAEDAPDAHDLSR